MKVGISMEKFKRYKLGMRTLKTGLSVAIGVFVAQLLNLRSPVFVVISAVMAMKASVSDSFTYGKNRLLGTLVGAILGLSLSYIFPQTPIFLGLGIIVVIYIHNLLNWKESISLSAIVFSIVFMNTASARLPYAVNRTIDTFIGIIVSMLVNYFIASPNKEEIFLEGVANIYEDSKDIVYDLVRGRTIDIDEVKSRIQESETEYETLKQDIDMNFHRTESESQGNFNTIFILLDDILDSISILSKIKLQPTPNLTIENIEMMQELFNLAILSSFDYELDNQDIVYNYHLSGLLSSLSQIEDLLGAELLNNN